MKRIGLKIEGKGTYNYYYSVSSVEYALDEMYSELKEGDVIEVKIGNEHRYIEHGFASYVRDVMYYVRKYLG